MAKSIQAQLNNALDDFYQLVRDEYEGAARDVAEECVRRLKSVQWKVNAHRNYSRHWTLTKERWGSFTVHNKGRTACLTHLLENGHIAINSKGIVGRAGAHKHIAPVYEWAQGEIVREVKQRIERGNG